MLSYLISVALHIWPAVLALAIMVFAFSSTIASLFRAGAHLLKRVRHNLEQAGDHSIQSGQQPHPGRRRDANRLYELVMTESDLHIDHPIPLSGRPDEVYRSPDGTLTPVDTKTRKRAEVYASDRIQLSAYAMLLLEAQHSSLGAGQRRVSAYGYLRIRLNSGKVTWKRVRLLPPKKVVGLYKRRAALEQGRTAPTAAANPAMCRGCEFRLKCPSSRVG